MATTTSTTTSQLDPQVTAILDQFLKSQQTRTPLQQQLILGAMQRLNPGGYGIVFPGLPPDILAKYNTPGFKFAPEYFSTGLTPDEEDLYARGAQRGVSDVMENTPSRGGALESNLRNTMINAAMTRSTAASRAKQLGLERAGAVAGVNVPIPGLPRTAVSSTTRSQFPTMSSLSGIGQLLGLGSSSGLFSSMSKGLSGLFGGGGSSSFDLGPALNLLDPSGGTLFGDFGGGFGSFDDAFDFGF